jgi:transketolase
MRAVAGLPVVVPAGPRETRSAVRWAASLGRGSYLRIPRFKVPEVSTEEDVFEPGRAVELRAGSDVTLVAIGTMVSRALWAADTLAAEGVQARVLNMPFVEPLDRSALAAAASETGGIVTVEEATVSGGLGAAVASVVSQHHPTRMRILGIDNAFAPTGSASYLLDHFGLNADGIVRAAREVLSERHG